jgi:hypothetical protein
MNADHIKAVFKTYIQDPNEQFALLINGAWGSGKTYFWEKELKPLAEMANKQTLYISLNGIASRSTLEQMLFIKMWPFLNRGDSKRNTQFGQLIGNALSMLAKKKLDVNLPDLVRGLSLDTIMYADYLICFDDLERCRIPLAEVLGFINDFVEHRKLKTLILSDETKVNSTQPDFAGIKEKVIGRTLNFHIDHELILPQLLRKYSSETEVFVFLNENEIFIRDLLRSFKEDNLRIIDFCLSIIARIYPVLKGQNPDNINNAVLCALTIGIDYKRGFLHSDDEGDYKELNMITVVQHFWSQPDQGGDVVPTELIKGPYPKAFFERYLKGFGYQFNLWKPIYDFILSGYLDETALLKEFEERDPNRIPEHIICFPLLINYKFRKLSDEDFLYFEKKTRQYAEDGLYTIYNYLQIADFYFYFSDNNLISLSYDEILSFVRKGLGKAAHRRETNDEAYGNMMHFKKNNDASEKFKGEVSMVHMTIIREKKREAVAHITSLIQAGKADEIEKAFNEQRFDKDFLPAVNMDAFCSVLRVAPNKSISQLAIIFEERYNAGIVHLLLDDGPPLKILESEVGKMLAYTSSNRVRHFVLQELRKGIKEGIARVENVKMKK